MPVNLDIEKILNINAFKFLKNKKLEIASNSNLLSNFRAMEIYRLNFEIFVNFNILVIKKNLILNFTRLKNSTLSNLADLNLFVPFIIFSAKLNLFKFKHLQINVFQIFKLFLAFWK